MQEVVEAGLARLASGRGVPLTVAGRTDAGVHAWAQVASHPGEPFALRALNGVLPDDVSVLSSEAAPDDFDARGDATSRAYRYRVFTRSEPSVWERRRAFWYPRPLDPDVLDACAVHLAGERDFTAFTPSEGGHRHFTRRVLRAGWRRDGDVLEFWIEADAFLRHMNRVLVGTMLEAAIGRRTADEFGALLEGRPRAEAGATAPPHALALVGVGYGGAPVLRSPLGEGLV